MTTLNLRFLVVLLITTLTVILLVALGVASLVFRAADQDRMAADQVRQTEYQTRQTEFNATMLRVLLALSDCTAEDTPDECRQRRKDRDRAEGVGRVAEVDCRNYRSHAGLPALPPNDRCSP